MSSANDDRTIALDVSSRPGGQSGATPSSVIDVPSAHLTCTDPSGVDGTLPDGGRIRLVGGSEQIVGRGETCTYPIPSRKLSRQHARFFPGVGVWGVEDLNSTNGVQVNRQKVKTAWLKHGDEVRVGPIPFRFEIDQIAAQPRPQTAAAEEGEGERTMMVGGLGASMAIIEAERKKEAPPPEPVATRTAGHHAGTQAATAKGGGGTLVALLGAGVVVAALVGAGVFYYPTFAENQTISDILDRNDKRLAKIIDRARTMSAAEFTADKLMLDLKALEPVNQELWGALNDYPKRAELANAYARARILMFERAFRPLFEGSDITTTAELVSALKSNLKEISGHLPAGLAEKDKEDLTTAFEIADLASIMIDYRRFARRYPNTGAATGGEPGAVPPTADLDALEKRKVDLENYRRALNNALASDYRIFYDLMREFMASDWMLVGRWREALRASR